MSKPTTCSDFVCQGELPCCPHKASDIVPPDVTEPAPGLTMEPTMLNDETVPADNSIKSGENYTEPASDSTDELREQLAAIEHERWADWQAWSHKILRENCPSPELEAVLERWDKQIATPYDQLSPKEQASDMEQVDRYWSLITRYIEGIVIEARLDEVVWYSNQVGILHKPWDKYEVMRKTALREQRQRLANPARTDKEGETA